MRLQGHILACVIRVRSIVHELLLLKQLLLLNRLIADTDNLLSFRPFTVLIATVPQPHDLLQVNLLVARQDLFAVSLVIFIHIDYLIALIISLVLIIKG